MQVFACCLNEGSYPWVRRVSPWEASSAPCPYHLSSSYSKFFHLHPNPLLFTWEPGWQPSLSLYLSRFHNRIITLFPFTFLQWWLIWRHNTNWREITQMTDSKGSSIWVRAKWTHCKEVLVSLLWMSHCCSFLADRNRLCCILHPRYYVTLWPFKVVNKFNKILFYAYSREKSS